jgi:hypothetical protein
MHQASFIKHGEMLVFWLVGMAYHQSHRGTTLSGTSQRNTPVGSIRTRSRVAVSGVTVTLSSLKLSPYCCRVSFVRDRLAKLAPGVPPAAGMRGGSKRAAHIDSNGQPAMCTSGQQTYPAKLAFHITERSK